MQHDSSAANFCSEPSVSTHGISAFTSIAQLCDWKRYLDYHSIVAFGSGFQDLIEKLNHQPKLVDIVRANHRSSIGSSILLKMAENV